MEQLRTFFENPQRQALLWALVGIIGVSLLAIGVYLTQSSNDPTPASAPLTARPKSPTPAATSTSSAGTSASATPTDSPTPDNSPSPSPLPPARQQNQQGNSSAPTPTNTPEPPPPTATPVAPTATPAPVVAGGGYCGPSSGIPTPAKIQRIAGRLTIGGQAAAAGQAVSVTFDGIAGVSTTSVDGGGYGATYDIGGPNCANRPGAAIALVFKGISYPTGLAVPPENNASFQQYDLAAPP